MDGRQAWISKAGGVDLRFSEAAHLSRLDSTDRGYCSIETTVTDRGATVSDSLPF